MKKEKQNRTGSKVIYIAVFAAAGLLLFVPVFLRLDFFELKTLGLPGIALINFFSSSTLFLPAPGLLATGIGAQFYNPILVALASAIGSTLGEGVGYAFGYSSRQLTASQKHILDRFTKILHHKHTAILIFLFAFIPNPIFDAVGILAGSALFPLRKFLVIVFAGRLLRDVIFTFIVSRLL